MINISGKTRICGLIGDPVEHSISPAIHNAAFEECGLDFIYLPFHVPADLLEGAIKGMRALGLRGLNVTMPHKVSVISYLDKVDMLAREIGAVNTIVNDGEVLTGYNTDALGFLRSLEENSVQLRAMKVVLIGAGGVARAIGFALAKNGADITILNRKQEISWAMELAGKIERAFYRPTRAMELNDENLAEAVGNSQILVNATSVGMVPGINETPVNKKWLREDLIVYDVVYNPSETLLLKEARQTGAKTIGGLDMLVWQAAMAFEMWTGQTPPVELMKRVAKTAMGVQ